MLPSSNGDGIGFPTGLLETGLGASTNPKSFMIDPDSLHQPSLSHSKRLLATMERQVPKVKLEIMGVGALRGMLGVMWALGTFNLLLEIIIVAAIAGADTPSPGETSTLWSGVYMIEGITRSLGVVSLLLMLLVYPQRIIRHYAARADEKPFWNQILVIMITILMSIVPAYSVYELVIFWMDYAARSSTFASDDTSISFSFGILTLLYPYPSGVIAYNTVTSMIVLAFTFLFFGGVYHNLYQAAKQSEEMLHPDTAQETDEGRSIFRVRGRSTSTKGDEIKAEDDEEADDNSVTRHFQAELALHAKSCLLNCYEVLVSKVRRGYHRYMSRTGYIPLGLQLSVLVYLFLLIALPISFSFHPSVVPMVSIISIIRICSADVTDFLPYNITETGVFADADGSVLANATVIIIQRSQVESDELGVCSPSQSYRLPFQRSFAVVVFFIVEVWLFAYVVKLGSRTRRYLRGTSYAQTRREILGYHYFRRIAAVCWVFIYLAAIFSAAVNPLDMYILEDGLVQYNITSNTFTIDISVDPLFQVGVGVGTIGFGAFFAMIMTWIILLAFAYLPADSNGVKGWFVGNMAQQGDEAMVAALKHSDYLLLVSTESDVVQLIELRRREKEALKELPTFIRKFRQQKHLMQGHSSLNLFDTGMPLIVQVRANVLVLETEILLFHFMHLSYVLAGTKLNPETKEKIPLSWEEKQLLVEDPRYRLEEHIIDLETDTHVMVFCSEDRVVVTFRGSVSLTNWQTDFDSAEVACEYVKDVSPDLQDVPPTMAQRARKMASKPPLVHGGFVKAYESVREKLTKLCERLLFHYDDEEKQQPNEEGNDIPSKDGFANIPSTNRVLFITGHSLGGGLAILCAADLAVTLRLQPGRIAVTTWGSPKVGTYSFMTRFNRIVRCARRFCMADDIITKLPVNPMFQALSLKGWWHCGTEILLNESGNMLIRPSPLERFMFSRTIGTPQAHLRMSYATALMIWVVRSHPDYEPDWWVGVVTLFYKNAQKRLKGIPRNLREKLLHSLLKAGVTYLHGNRLVRDMMVDTTDFENSNGIYNPAVSLLKTAAPEVPRGDRNEVEEQEPEVAGMVTALLVSLRLHNEGDFNQILDTLVSLRAKGEVFSSEPRRQALKRTQTDADIEEEGPVDNRENETYESCEDDK